MTYPRAIAHPPASVTIAKRGEASFVSHMPAKSSHGAANSSAMIHSAAQRGSPNPSAITDNAAAMTAYMGMWTCVSWTSRLRST